MSLQSSIRGNLVRGYYDGLQSMFTTTEYGHYSKGKRAADNAGMADAYAGSRLSSTIRYTDGKERLKEEQWDL